MTHADFALTSLCIWREARSQGKDGMTAVAFVIRNRAHKHMTSPYFEVTKRLQFSSITAPGDLQLGLWPASLDYNWALAQTIAETVLSENPGEDPTHGSTIYFNPDAIETTKTIKLADGSTVPFPEHWNPAVLKQTAVIGTKPQSHVFFVEAK